MDNTRIDRMLRELHSEPTFQFFQAFFNLRPALAVARAQPQAPVSLLKHARSA